MSSKDLKPGDPIEPCQNEPTLRKRSRDKAEFSPSKSAKGYTSRGYVEHFLPDREVNVAKLTKALADVYGEPALRIRDLQLELDKDYWVQLCSDPWSGNIYRYNF